MIPVEFFLVLSTLLFFIGVFGFVTRRNLIAMLISTELVLNSVDINFAVFNRLLYPGELEGFFFTLFSIGVHDDCNLCYHVVVYDSSTAKKAKGDS